MKSIFKAIHPETFTWVKYTKNQKAGRNRNQSSDAGTTETWAPLSQWTVLNVNSSLQKPKKPFCAPQLIHSRQQHRGSTVTCDRQLLQKSKRVEIICGHLGGHYLPVQPSLLACSSLAAAHLLRVQALSVCLNKKADKECLSVSSIWSPRLFESIWVYLAGHADSLWAIYHDKKTPEIGTMPVSSLPFPPPTPFSPPGYWCYIKTNLQFT